MPIGGGLVTARGRCGNLWTARALWRPGGLAQEPAVYPFERPRHPAPLASEPDKQTVGPVGIEPTTRGLKVRCSAD
jgi:hypothetical protein